MQFYKFYIDDYICGSARLTINEDLCLRRLLDLYYKTEQPLDLDLERLAKAIGFHNHAMTVVYIIDNFFLLTDDGYRNARADKEIARHQSKISQAKRAGQASSAKRVNMSSSQAELEMNVRSIPVEEKKKKGITASDMQQVSEDLAKEFLNYRKAVKAPLTILAWNQILKEALKSGWEPDEAITECMTRGWKSFKAEWVKPKREAQQAKYEQNVFSSGDDCIEGTLL